MVKHAMQFWLHYRKQTVLIMSVIIFSTMIILNVLLFLRGNDMTNYERTLDGMGDYNYCFLNMTAKQLEQLKESDYFEQAEVLYDEGQIGRSDKKLFPVASAGSDALQMFHYRLQEGRYPKKENEIALFEDTCKQLGAPPVIGEELRVSLYNGDTNKGERTYRITGILRANDRYWYSQEGENPYPYGFVGASKTDVILLGMANKRLDVNANLAESWLGNNGYRYERTDGKDFTEADLMKAHTVTQEAVREAMKGYHINDFETVILIPLFSVIIMMLALISLFYSIVTVLKHRRDSLSLYCLLGMTKGTARWSVTIELVVIAMLSLAIGLGVGTGLYVLVVYVLSHGFHYDIVSAFAANKIIRLRTLPPYGMAIAFILGSVLLSLVWVLADWRDVSPLEAVRRVKASGKSSHRKRRMSVYGKVFGVGFKSHLANASILFLLLATVYGVALLMSYKWDIAISEYQETLKEAEAGDYDYVAKRDFSIGTFSFCCLNRREAGFTKEDIKLLEEAAKGGEIKKAIKVPSMKVIEPDVRHKQVLGTSLPEYYHEVMAGYEDMFRQGEYILGYSEDIQQSMYNVPVVGVDSDALSLEALNAELIDGSIHADKLQSGEEVLLVVKEKGMDAGYRVGEQVAFTDNLIDPKDTAYSYNFSEGGVVGGGREYSYNVINPEDGSIVDTKKGVRHGYRKDAVATIGGIIYLNSDGEGKANFYESETMQPATEGVTEEAKIQFITGVEALREWEMQAEVYNHVGVKLKNAGTNKDFMEKWYRVYGRSMDMEVQSVAGTKAEAWQENMKYSVIFLVFCGFLLLLGFLSIYQCIQLQIIEKKEQLGMLRLLGMEKWYAVCLYFSRYIKYLLGAAAVSWLPLFLNWLHKQYIIHISLKLVEKFDLTKIDMSTGDAQIFVSLDNYSPEHIRKYCDVIEGVDYRNWFYYLDGGIYDFSGIPVIAMYIGIVLIFGMLILSFVYWQTRHFVTDNILEDMHTEE